MEKFQVDSKDDIVEEKYTGPSAHIAALGTGVIKHLKWAAIGLIGGTATALIFHKPAKGFIEGAREFGSALKAATPTSESFFAKVSCEIKKLGGGITHILFGDKEMAAVLRSKSVSVTPKQAEWLATAAMNKEQGFGNIFISHTIGAPFKKNLRKLTEPDANEVIRDALTFGGAFGAGGYVSGWLVALVSGAKHGNDGKHQFNRAKAEIKDLRERNDDLEKVNDALHKKYVEAATQKDTAGLEQPTISESAIVPEAALAAHEPQAAMAEKPSHKIHHQADAAMEHHGKIHAHQQHEHAAHTHA